jgi:hypothetical protein
MTKHLRKITNWRLWLRGLSAAIIGGGANAVTAMVVEPTKFNFVEGWPSLWHFTVVSMVVSAALYLKQSPVPPEEDVEEIADEA